METVLGILFLVMLVIFIGIIISMACGYESQLKDAETRRINDLIDINRGPHVCYKDKLIKERDIEIKEKKKE